MSRSVLVVEDDSALREALCDTLGMSGISAISAAGAGAAMTLLEETTPDLVVSDIHMPERDGMSLLHGVKARFPDMPVLLMTAYATVEQAVRAMHEGAADYLVKPFEAEVLVAKVSQYLGGDASDDDELVVADARSRELMSLARRVAGSDVTVLITGESGSGKEVLARFIHRESRRRRCPFVAINCAAIPENMLEAVLFGYEKGAFTGALKACPGKFEQAHTGTLLLDEVSELALGLQAKLLRVLQEKEVERLGAKGVTPLDLRVLATSNADMREAVRDGRFREDLYYRLNVFPLHLRPLRERPGDIVPIAERLIARAAHAQRRTLPELSAEAERRLAAYHWPGNVRELDNTIQRALVLEPGGRLEMAELACPATVEPPAAPVIGDDLGEKLRSREHKLILEVLDSESGNRSAAAARLGISARTLRYKLARMREAGIAVG